VKVVTPSIHIVHESREVPEGLTEALKVLGAPNWRGRTTSREERTHSDAEDIVEATGRLCYMSFGTELNQNLTRVREGNGEYINNILKSKHGSVLEHVTTGVWMLNVSRILTHELVRHRAGTAFSQTSGRFVRIDDIPIGVPDLTAAFDELQSLQVTVLEGSFWQSEFDRALQEVAALAEIKIKKMSHMLDHPKVPFALKKKITSALRRFAPGGHATNIAVTANHRAWRHMIANRTSVAAEEEIRHVFGMIAEEFTTRYPALYQDMHKEMLDNHYQYTFENDKI
jgi:thymidylate synthase (FAD)